MKKLFITLSIMGLSATQVNASVSNTYEPLITSATNNYSTVSGQTSYATISNNRNRSITIVTPDRLGELEALSAQAQQKENRLSGLSQELVEYRPYSFATTANSNTISNSNSFGGSRSYLDSSAPPALAAARASRSAYSSTRGLCAHYVRKALQSAGYSFTPNESAYQYATRGTLAEAGFVKISNNSSEQIGDIVVYNRSGAHPHGHIQIYDGSGWVSDFRQNSKNPYSDSYSFTTWRDARYLNDASNQGVYLAMGE